MTNPFDGMMRAAGMKAPHHCRLCHQHPNFEKYPQSIKEVIELAAQLSEQISRYAKAK